MNDNGALERITLTNQKINDFVNDFKVLTEARIVYSNIQLLKYINLIYLRAMHDYTRAIFHHSFNLWAALKAIWDVFVIMWASIKIIIELLHIREVLQLIDILSVFWPALRDKMNEIYGKITEFSEQIGWGADGIAHIMSAAQGVLNLIGGFLGKDETWLQIRGMDKVVKTMERLSEWSLLIQVNPGILFDWLFRSQSDPTLREHKEWWNDKMLWLEKTADNVKDATLKVKGIIDNFQEFENKMPAFIRDNIPSWIGNSIDWADAQIDNTILPKLTEIGQTMTIINARIEAQRKKAQELADRLAHPGDMLNDLNLLDKDDRAHQDQMLDEAVSGQFARENEEDKVELKPIWEGFRLLLDALSEPPPTPTYLQIEDRPAPVIRFPKAVVYDSWDIYDFVA